MSSPTGPEIARLVKAGVLQIHPFSEDRVNANSYNLSVGRTVLMYEKGADLHDAWEGWYESSDPDREPPRFVPLPLSMRKPEPTVSRLLATDEEIAAFTAWGRVRRFWPGVVYLLATEERTVTPKEYRPVIDGRSSVGRLGVFCHVTAGFGESGFDGHWTLEFVAVQPVEVAYPLLPAQISYVRTEGAAMTYSGQRKSKYQNQPGMPVASRLWQEYDQNGG